MYLSYLSDDKDYLAPDDLIFNVPSGPPSGGQYSVNSWAALSLYTHWVNSNLKQSNVKTSQDAILYALNKGYINSGVAYTWIDFIANPTKYVGTGKTKVDFKSIAIWGGVVLAIGVAFMYFKKKGL